MTYSEDKKGSRILETERLEDIYSSITLRWMLLNLL